MMHTLSINQITGLKKRFSTSADFLLNINTRIAANKNQYQSIIKNKTFESRIQELLSDFGLSEIKDKA